MDFLRELFWLAAHCGRALADPAPITSGYLLLKQILQSAGQDPMSPEIRSLPLMKATWAVELSGGHVEIILRGHRNRDVRRRGAFLP